MTMRTPVPVSFEFFPPNTPVGSQKLKAVVSELATVEPEFFSVTYGAGGSTRDKTLATVSEIAALGHEAAPHLSCVGSTRSGISEILATYRAQKIRRVVALREPGDDVEAEGADRRRVVHEAFHLQRDPARDLDAVARRERRGRLLRPR